MIVVAIIAILASIAVPMYMRTIRRAKASEVPAMFAEFKTRQQGYYTENGVYLSSGAGENDTHPISPAGPDTPATIAPIPDSWKALRIQSDKTALYCAYVTIAGLADNGGTIGAKAAAFGMTPPKTDWFYVLAECDFDGKPTNSFYFTSSELDTTVIENQGR